MTRAARQADAMTAWAVAPPHHHTHLTHTHPSAAVSIETGMQSAAMGYALSTKHYAAVLVAVPSSVSIVFMVSDSG